MRPNPTKFYKSLLDNSICKIWHGEELSDDIIILFDCETGHDKCIQLSEFNNSYTEYLP
jgi:hypothetical protein